MSARPRKVHHVVLLLLIAIVAFLLAAFGVGSKLGIDIVDLGLAFFAAAFIFG